MDLNTPLFVQSTKDYILPSLVDLARFNKESKDDNRGKTFFKAKSLQKKKNNKAETYL